MRYTKYRNRLITQGHHVCLIAVGAALLASGCGGSSGTSASSSASAPGTVDLSNPAAPLARNTYIGTQNAWNKDGIVTGAVYPYEGEVALTLDSGNKSYAYQMYPTNIGPNYPNTYPGGDQDCANYVQPYTSAFPGTYNVSNGFFDLTLSNPRLRTASCTVGFPGAEGYSLEIPGRVALTRMGDSTQSLIFAVDTSQCINLTSPATFQFIAFGTPFSIDNSIHLAYGSIKVATAETPESLSGTQPGNAGITSTFSNYQMFALDGTALKPDPLGLGTCAFILPGFATTVPGSAQTASLPQTVVIGPSGFFLVDQGQGDPTSTYGEGNIGLTKESPYPGPTGPLGLIGVIQPASPLDTPKLVGASYAGFAYDPLLGTQAGLQGTYPVMFGDTGSGQTAGSGSVMYGGGFPSDDITQAPQNNISIDLGQQDSTNGLYKNVTVTIFDRYNACVQQPDAGVAPDDSPACVFHGIAIAGQPEGKHAVFVTVNDTSLQVRGYTPKATLHFVLFER